MLGLYLYFYLQPHMRKTYGFRASLHINPVLLKKLFRYGAPTGTEFFLIFIVFTCFTSLYHSYGEGPALAMTAVQNWDVLSFLPMWGLNIGLMSLVGRHLGARNIDLALRTTWSGFKVAAIVVGASVIAFTLFPEPLLQVFLPETMTLDRSQVLGLGIPMLRLVALYCVAHSINLVLGATLRAAGDTRACMYAGISIHWSLLLVVYLSVRYWQFPPLVTWQFFVYGAFAESLFFILRFYWGPWKTARVI